MKNFLRILLQGILVCFVLLLFSCPTPGSDSEYKVPITEPDLYPSTRMALTYYTTGWTESHTFTPGQEVRISYKYDNLGVEAANQSFTIDFYLSDDPIITSADSLLYSSTGTRTLVDGLNPETDGLYYVSPETTTGHSAVTIPAVAPGVYYLGCILDSTNQITEFDETNNTTPQSMARQILIKDSTANTTGAFKFVNSWGLSSSWENIVDGHYWFTYQSMKTLGLVIYYYDNDFSVEYRPTVVAVFRLTHPERDKCTVKFILGDPASPYMAKEFEASIFSGPEPFPGNNLAFDISEFANLINYYDLKLSITTEARAVAGTVNTFDVRYYSNSSGSLIKTIHGNTGSFTGNASTTNFTALTYGALSPEDQEAIIPPLRSTQDALTFVADLPPADELAADMAAIGIFEPGKNYNQILDGHGTGFAPPTEEEWAQMRKLRSVETGLLFSVGLNSEIDHSQTQYFPPIGNQGGEGSCTCWATGYYTHTFTMAKENGWNLTGTTYGGTYPGAPQSNTDKIMSPDFIYHQINGGGDNGSSATKAFRLLTQMGGATWSQMPYNDDDSTTWPSASAYLEAPRYRGRDVFRLSGSNYGYFIINDDSDINMLKQLLLNGFIVTTAIDAYGCYDLFDAYDVLDISSLPIGYEINHAQTIVGFKDGSAWHPSTPDD